jgi:hypothetical protein
MSSETWALVGVIVGALLGGTAQVVADWLRQRHERRSAARTDRREAYTEFLAAATTALAPVAASREAFQAENEEGKTAALEQAESVLVSSARQALDRLSVAAARVDLVGPEDTHAAAMSVMSAVLAYMVKDEEGMVESLADAHREFSRLAKRDLA